MTINCFIIFITLLTVVAPATAAGQVASALRAPANAIGELVGLDAERGLMSIKTDSGSISLVRLKARTTYLLVAPGETNLERAVKITLVEISLGDRIFARGLLSEDQKSIDARSVVVMARTQIARKQEAERAEWQQRGIGGRITALSVTSNEISLVERSAQGLKPIIVDVSSGNVRFRRYRADSVKFSDAGPSSFAELKVGDQLRAIGKRSADGSRFKPTEVISGSFRSLAGTVISTDSKSNEVKISPLGGGNILTVIVTEASVLRHVTDDVAAMIVKRIRQGTNAATTASSTEAIAPREAASNQASDTDFQQAIDRSSAISVSDLKPGDRIIFSTSAPEGADRATAIVLIKGVEPILNFLQQQSQAGRSRGSNVTAGLPTDALGGAISP